MTEHSIRIDSESDEYNVTVVEAVPPTWRDLWAIVRWRYVPAVRKVKRLTVKGMDRILKQTYTKEIAQALDDSSPFMEAFEHAEGQAVTVPIKGRKAHRS